MGMALLIIDVQNAYVRQPGFRDMIDQAAAYINEVGGYFRLAHKPVIHVQHADPEMEGRPEDFAVDARIRQDESDLYLTKHSGNAFWKTDLEDLLRKTGVDYVVCCGLSASYCVLATYNGALERGFAASMLQNGLLGKSPEEVARVCTERHVVDFATIGYMLKNIR